jgi:hypothetical protein
MPAFKTNAFATPFGKNVYLRNTEYKTVSATLAASTVTARTIDSFGGQKVIQPGTVLARITTGSETGKVGPFQSAGTNEVQTVTITGTPTGGTFTLTFAGQATAAIAHNATAAAVRTALENLSNIAAGDVTVAGSAGGPYTVTFVGALGGRDQSQMTATASFTGGTSPTAAVATTTAGVAGATDGRQTAANIVGICNTFLPWQLMHRDVEVAVVYDAAVVQASCIEYNAAGADIALTNTTRDAMVAKTSLNILFF